MDIREIRRKNLLWLVRDLGGGKQRVLGELIGKDPSLISQILQRRRNMGEDLARDIERQLNMKVGSMDRQAGSVIEKLPPAISKRAREIIQRLKIMAERGDFAEDDLDILEHLLERLKRTPN